MPMRDKINAARMVFPAGVFISDGSPYHHINVHVGAPVRATVSRDGKAVRGLQSPGDMEIIPAGQNGRWEDESPAELVSVRIAPDYFEAAAVQLGADHHHPRAAAGVRDPVLAHTLLALEAAFKDGAPPCALTVDSLTVALVSRLLNQRSEAPAAKPLAARKVNAAIDHIRGNLSGSLLLEDLARVSGVGLSQFKAAFKAATGLSPRRYIIRERVHRAQALIAQTDLPLVAIAMETGFSHQSHLTRAMRQELGLTPGALVRSRRGRLIER